MKSYEELLAFYDSLVEECKGFKRKGKTVPYTSANGHMFSFINKAGELGFRFSEPRKTELMKSWNSTEFISHGAVMKGYVLIPAHLFEKREELKHYLTESFNYVMLLPSK